MLKEMAQVGPWGPGRVLLFLLHFGYFVFSSLLFSAAAAASPVFHFLPPSSLCVRTGRRDGGANGLGRCLAALVQQSWVWCFRGHIVGCVLKGRGPAPCARELRRAPSPCDDPLC